MFPPEIIDHVLSFLQRDHEILNVCAGAHPSLSILVERHFYRHLTVKIFDPCLPDTAGTYHPSDFLKLFVDKPNIAKHVRSLQIYLTIFGDYRALETILPALTQLRSISLAIQVDRLTVWNDLHDSFRTAFTDCLRLPTLTYVQLILLGIKAFPLSVLDHSSSLKRLSLWGDFSYLPPASPLVNVCPPLYFLNLGRSSKSIEIIASWVESRSLHSLRLYQNFEQSSRLLEVCANTLTTLHIDFPVDYSATSTISFSLSFLPHLAQLTVQTPIHFDLNTEILSCLPATMRCLGTLPSPPTNLVNLVIEVDISIDNDSSTTSDTDWSPLISFPYFDVISRVELRVRAQRLDMRIPSVELLGELKQDPHLMQLEMHHSLLINAVEEPVVSWYDFGSA